MLALGGVERLCVGAGQTLSARFSIPSACFSVMNKQTNKLAVLALRNRRFLCGSSSESPREQGADEEDAGMSDEHR